MTAQLVIDLFAEPRCPWIEDWLGHPHYYLSMTFRFDCDACMELKEREKKARKK